MFVIACPQHAMQVVGLDDQTREDILSLVAGILHLGNIAFVENGNYAAIADPGCKLYTVLWLISASRKQFLRVHKFIIQPLLSYSLCHS